MSFCTKFVSSANKNSNTSKSLGKSLMKIISSTGPNTLYWVTSLVTFSQFDKVEFTRTCCLLCNKKFLIQNNRLGLTP